MDLYHLALKETSKGQSMTFESMQQLTQHSLAVTQASISDENSRAVFVGANISRVSGCQFQISNGPVKIIQETQIRRRAVIESDDYHFVSPHEAVCSMTFISIYVN